MKVVANKEVNRDLFAVEFDEELGESLWSTI